jgi:hypothetical protein
MDSCKASYWTQTEFDYRLASQSTAPAVLRAGTYAVRCLETDTNRVKRMFASKWVASRS